MSKLPLNRVKPAISWPGGKSRLLQHLLPKIPEHYCYCEPFAGGLALLLAKGRSRLEVINDINGDLIAFYRCVRFHVDALISELEFVLNSREEFRDFITQPGLTDIQRAARWFFRNKNCFGGTDLKSFGTSALGGGASHGSRQARMETIRALSLRLDRVCVERLDWQRCVELYDRATTFFFLDPPYTECGETMYKGWTDTDVQALKNRLDLLRGRWLLTLNDTPSIRAIFEGCEITAVDRAKGINGKAAEKRYRELVIAPSI
jgi:DNA adenine methylase